MTYARNLQSTYLDGGDPDRIVTSLWSPNAVGDTGIAHGSAGASAVWPSANLGLFYPFVVTGADIQRAYPRVVWMNGSAVSGNIDVGIYDALGNKLGTLGSTAQSGTTAPQAANFAIPVQLGNGRYYLGVAMDNGTGQLVRSAPTAIAARGAGIRQRAASFPLPASVATWVGTTNAYVPWVGISEVGWV